MSITSVVYTAISPMAGIDPKVVANDSAPWLPFLRTVAGWVLVTAIVALVALMIIGALMLVGGKISNTQGAQQVGTSFLLWGFAATVVIGSISGLVYFFSQQSITPSSAAGAFEHAAALPSLIIKA